MPTTTNFEQNFSIPSSSKKKFVLSDFRRRFSFSPRNTILFTKLDLEKDENISRNSSILLFVKDNDNLPRKKHQRSTSECIKSSHDNVNDEFEYFDDFEEIQHYTPIFKRNENQLVPLDYEESNNEVILDEYSFKRKTWLAVKKFTGVGQDKKKHDKENQDGKTNPFE